MDFQDIPKTVCNSIQEKSIQRHIICMIDADHDYILYESERRGGIEFERNVSGNSYEE